MGLLDNDPQEPQGILNPSAQGFLSAGLGILASNRGLNAGLPAIGLGGLQGINAYQEALKFPLQQKLLAAQAGKLGAEAEQQKLSTDLMKKRMEFFQNLGGQSQNPQPQGPLGGGEVGDQATQSAMSAIKSSPQGSIDKVSPIRAKAMSYLNLSDKLLGAGLPEDAATYAKMGKELLPTLSKTEVVTDPASGQRIMINSYNDGSTERLPYNPDAEKLDFSNIGGAIVGKDPFTGQVISSLPTTPSPDAVMKNATEQRGQNITGGNAGVNTFVKTGIVPPFTPGMGASPPIQQGIPQGMPQQPPMIPQGGPQGLPQRPPIVPPIQGQPPMARPPAIVTPQPNIQAPIMTPAARTEIAMNTAKASANKDIEYLNGLKNTASNASLTGIHNLDDMQKSINNGVYSGPWAAKSVDAANFLKNTFGVNIDSKALANSQVFQKEAVRLIQDQVKAFGGGRVLASEISTIKDAVPRLDTDPAARQQIIDMMRTAYNRQINQYRSAQAYFDKNGSLSGYDVTQFPGSGAAKQFKTPPTQADIEYNAKLHGKTVEQVKRELGL